MSIINREDLQRLNDDPVSVTPEDCENLTKTIRDLLCRIDDIHDWTVYDFKKDGATAEEVLDEIESISSLRHVKGC